MSIEKILKLEGELADDFRKVVIDQAEAKDTVGQPSHLAVFVNENDSVVVEIAWVLSYTDDDDPGDLATIGAMHVIRRWLETNVPGWQEVAYIAASA